MSLALAAAELTATIRMQEYRAASLSLPAHCGLHAETSPPGSRPVVGCSAQTPPVA